MKLDFWNNPLVVSAFRVKYRRGGLSSMLILYTLFLTMGWAAMQYYSPFIGVDWQRKFFIALMMLQFAVSVFMATLTTANSIRLEVVNRTLDFQRIATLSPQQILFGKLLGEPALAYLLAIASIPVAVWTWLSGGQGGVNIDVIVCMYVNLATLTIMGGSFGLGNRLEMAANRPNSQPANEGAVFGLMAAVALAVPLFAGLIRGDLFAIVVPFFGKEIPYVFLAPVIELALAVLPFHIMVRLLVNPQSPMLTKNVAYISLLAIDVLACAVLLDPSIWGPAVKTWYFSSRCATFCLVHLFASGILCSLITPRGEIVETWMWRFRDRRHAVHDWLLGPRSPNLAAVGVFAIIGIAAWTLLMYLPAQRYEGSAVETDVGRVAIPALAATSVFVLAGGFFTQLLSFLPGKRRTVVSNLVSVLIFVPYLVGKLKDYYNVELIIDLSPIDQYKNWLNPGLEPRDVAPLLVMYVFITIASAFAVAIRLGTMQRKVDAKLVAMGVQPQGA